MAGERSADSSGAASICPVCKEPIKPGEPCIMYEGASSGALVHDACDRSEPFTSDHQESKK